MRCTSSVKTGSPWVERNVARQRHVVDRGDQPGRWRHDRTHRREHRSGIEWVIRRNGLSVRAGSASFDVHALAASWIERAERLVHQHDLGVMPTSPAIRRPLLHAADNCRAVSSQNLSPTSFTGPIARGRYRSAAAAHIDRQHHVGENICATAAAANSETRSHMRAFCHLLASTKSPGRGRKQSDIIFRSVTCAAGRPTRQRIHLH